MALALLATTAAQAAPITFNTALPVARGEAVVRGQLVWSRSTGDTSGLERRLDTLAVPVVLAYGLHPRVTLFGVLPFTYKRLELAAGDRREARSTSGFGDMTVLIRGTALRFDAPGRTGRLAAFLGLKLPTGADDESDSAGRLPPSLQLGSGSWDPLGGLVLTWQRLDWELDISAGYTIRTEANAFEGGDEARADISYQYRVVPWGRLDSDVRAFGYVVVESNVVWSDENRVAGAVDPSSGGLRWHLAPGFQWVTRRTVFEVAVQLPVLQRLNGEGLENDFVARLSFRANF